MGYVPSLPILSILNGNLCMKIPYIKYKITGEVDKTFVYPIKYIATVSIPEGVIVGFEDLAFNKSFCNVEFNSPIGLFRHDAVKSLNKESYKNLRKALYIEYDKIINHLLGHGVYSATDEAHFKTLFNVVLEPSLYPFYRTLDSDFANKYITSTK